MHDHPLSVYLIDRLAECGMPDRFYGWVAALDRDERLLPPDFAEHYTLTGEDVKTAWEAAGLKATGSGKGRKGTLVHPRWKLSSSLNSMRGSNFLEVTVNLQVGKELGGSLIHSLAAELLRRAGRPLPDPPYPRPWAYAYSDVQWYTERVAELLRDVALACDVAGPPGGDAAAGSDR
jgi:hypothetical protein